MKHKSLFIRALILSVNIVTGFLLQSFSVVEAQVIENVEVNPTDRQSVVKISFSRRLAYKAHAPVSRGDFLVIELRSLDGLGNDPLTTTRQSYPWRPSANTPLTEINFNQDPGSLPTITLRFTRYIRFNVRGASDGSNLEVTVFSPEAQQQTSTQTPAKPQDVEETEAPGDGLLQTGDDLKTSELMEQARIAMVNHKYDAAIDLYTQILQMPENKQNRQALEYLGLARELNGQPDQASAIYKKYLKQYPKTYRVILKSFLQDSDAKKLAQTLRKKGINAEVGMTVVSGVNWSRVQVPGFESKKAALTFADSVGERYGFNDAWVTQSAETSRIAQRSTNLATAEAKPRDQLRKGKANKSKDVAKSGGSIAAEPERKEVPLNGDYFASFSNFYNHFALLTDRGTDVIQSSVQTDLFLSGRVQIGEWEAKAYFSGGQLIDTLGKRNSRSPTRISNGYMDLNRESWGFNARLGRQNGYNGGVLGKFDGVNAGYQINDQIKINAVAGFPVEYTTVSRANTNNYFYGLNTDITGIKGPLESTIDFNFFFMQQFIDGTQDRLAIGGEMRYFTDNVNVFSLLDYDIMFNSLNIVTVNGNWRAPTQTNVNLLLDYRKAPIVTTSNALLYSSGVSDTRVINYTSIDDLLVFLSSDQIRDVAKRNSVDSYTGTLGFTHPINDKVQVGADFTATRLNGIPAIQVNSIRNPTNAARLPNPVIDTEALEGGGWEYFLSARVLGNSLIVPGDLASIDLRYSSLPSSSRYGILMNTRYPVSENFNIGPRFRVNYRYGYNGSNDWTFSPSLRMVYRFRPWIQFEAEAGSEFITGFIPDGNASFTEGNYYFLVGYRIDFSGDF